VVNEIPTICQAMQGDHWDFFHLRKPTFTEKDLQAYLAQLPQDVLQKTVVHIYPHLNIYYKGIAGYNVPFSYWKNYRKKIATIVSVGCHNFKEVETLKAKSNNLTHVFLSPVFQSISKEGYPPKYSQKELKAFLSTNDFPFKLIALGGINESRQKEVLHLGFDGFAVLGDFWKNYPMR
jgi:thiamine-phosphate pyrophosphorylase